MSQPRFTVVIPAFNSARTIGGSIRSVLQQTEQDFELIVVNDGSTDTTVERARSFASDTRIRVISQPNRGPAAARNTGLATARGSYVSWLDADDLWLPKYLEIMGSALDTKAEAPLAYTGAWVLDDTTKRVRRRPMSAQDPAVTANDSHTFFLRLLEQNFVYTSATTRRSVLEAVGGYDESLSTGEDWDLWLRIVRRGMLPVRVPGLLAIHRQRPGSLASDSRMMIGNVCEIYRRLAEDPTADEDVRKLAHRQFEYWRRSLERLEERPVLLRARVHVGALKRRVLRPWLWLRQPPEAVERTLRAAGEIA